MVLLAAAATAQSVGPAELNAAGHSAINGGIIHEYAIGSVLGTPAYVSGSLVVTPGVLQPQTGTVGTEHPGIAGSQLSVYPNPVEQTLFLKPAFGQQGTLQYLLTDGSGKTLATQTVRLERGDELQQILMSGYAVGQYNLQVSWQQQGQTHSNAYKIQKIK